LIVFANKKMDSELRKSDLKLNSDITCTRSNNLTERRKRKRPFSLDQSAK